MVFALMLLVGQISVDQFGANPGDWSDDSAAFQAAADHGGEIRLSASPRDANGNVTPYVLKQGIRLTKSCRWIGQGGKQDSGSTWVLIDCGSEPGFHRGTYARLNKVGDMLTHEIVGPLSAGTGLAASFEHICFQAVGPTSCAMQFYNCSAPFTIRSCTIGHECRGVWLSQIFNATIENCNFSGTAVPINSRDAYAREHFGCCVTGHASILQSSFQGCGTGLLCCGPQTTISGLRVEMCHHGIWLTNRNYQLEQLGQGSAFIGSLTDTIMESCMVGLRVDPGSRANAEQLTITSNRPERGRFGMIVGKDNRLKLDGLIISGMYSHAAARLDGRPYRYADLTTGNTIAGGMIYSRPIGQTMKKSAWSTGHAAFAQPPAVESLSESATIDHYRYVATIRHAGGETLGLAPAVADISVPNGTKVKMSFFGLPTPPPPADAGYQPLICRRIYRLRLNQANPDDIRCDGFWEIPIAQSSFRDEGQPFTGRYYPPN